MERNPKNIKVLNDDELEYLNERYIFGIIRDEDDKYISVKTINCNRLVLHNLKKNFSINSPIKRVTITTTAVNFWEELNKEYSLFSVQNVINILLLTYTEVTKENILSRIKKPVASIKLKEK